MSADHLYIGNFTHHLSCPMGQRSAEEMFSFKKTYKIDLDLGLLGALGAVPH